MKYILLFLSMIFATTALAAPVKTSGYEGNLLTAVSVSIANGQTASSLISLKGFSLVGIQTPAAFTGTALTFSSCTSDGATCIPLKVTTSGTALSYTVTTSSYYAIDPIPFYGVQYLKINSGSSEGGARVLLCSLKGI